MTDPIITLRDIHAVHQCRKGAQRFFERYGLDWHDFRRNGIKASQLEATGDALVKKVVEAVRGQQ